MIDHRFMVVFYFVSLIESTPRQIDLFLMGKKIIVKTVQFLIKGTAYKKASTRCPEYLPVIIILAFVFFYCVKNTSAAIWITVFIDEAACSSGIFKVVFIFEVQYFRLDDGCFRFFFESFDDG